MIFIIFFLNKTPLYIAVENGNSEIVKLLLNENNIDVNKGFVLKLFSIIKLKNIIFNDIRI